MKRAVGAVLLAGLGLSGGAASVERGAAARAEASPAPRGRNLVAEVNLAIQRFERGELEEAKRGFRAPHRRVQRQRPPLVGGAGRGGQGLPLPRPRTTRSSSRTR